MEDGGVTARAYLSMSPISSAASPTRPCPRLSGVAQPQHGAGDRSTSGGPLATPHPTPPLRCSSGKQPPRAAAHSTWSASLQPTLVVGWRRHRRRRRQDRLGRAVVVLAGGGGAPLPPAHGRCHPVRPGAHNLDHRRRAQRVGPRARVAARVLARVKGRASCARVGARRVGVNARARGHRRRGGGGGRNGSSSGQWRPRRRCGRSPW
ncbi:hypothetical protein I4F81_004650 [Pyropia yezoensis]|uniref:Uncharacterized protein n=1 Tax=Pyropia yezoensis TaxID=2788 RepID=A0ACC3BWJ3_PYRYE|nr:hypothetical protein I4F81_004650 [Neopyropia yezoensis]